MRIRQLLLTAVVTAMASMAFAAPGDLDPTFNGTGMLNIGFMPVNSERSIAIQPDGKVLIAGGDPADPSGAGKVLRLNPNGSPDLTFGTNGIALLAYPDGSVRSSLLMDIQSDGKIVMTTSELINNIDACGMTRLNADGSIDLGFGTMGRAAIRIPNPIPNAWDLSCVAYDIKSQPDGKIVVGGISSPAPTTVRDFVLLRFNADGSPDTSFSGDGLLTTDFGNTDDDLNSIAIQPDGKIVALGINLQHGRWDHDIARYNSDGTLDAAFGTGGKLVFGDPNAFDGGSALLIQPDEKILIAGGNSNTPIGFKMLRLNPDGSLDTGFGIGGSVSTGASVNGSYGGGGIAIQTDGKIFFGGAALVNANMNYTDMGVARYNADGSLDQAPAFAFGKPESVLAGPYWGTNGMSRIHFSNTSYSKAYCLRVDAAGRIVVYGRGAGSSTLLARFQGDNSPYAGIWGTVRTAGGLPIKNAPVMISDGGLARPVIVRTSNFGIYQFTGLPVTETYKLSISMKRYQFVTPEQTLMLNGDVSNLDFTANQ